MPSPSAPQLVPQFAALVALLPAALHAADINIQIHARFRPAASIAWHDSSPYPLTAQPPESSPPQLQHCTPTRCVTSLLTAPRSAMPAKPASSAIRLTYF